MPIPRLHVNVDHVATLRQARREPFPDPVEWALAAERAGAHGITCHLRKDRRHVQDADIHRLRGAVTTLLNLEVSLDPEMLGLAVGSGAEAFCVVPENRLEITTEGGLDVIREILMRALSVLEAFFSALTTARRLRSNSMSMKSTTTMPPKSRSRSWRAITCAASKLVL